MDAGEINKLFEEYKSGYDQASGMRDFFKEEKDKLELKVVGIQDEVDYLKHASIIMEKFIREANEETLKELKETLNEGILLNFLDFQSELDIEYKVTPSNQKIIFTFKKGEFTEEVKGGQSGGMLDVVSLLSRVVFIDRKGMRPFLCIDEALNGVSQDFEYARVTSTLLNTISDKYGFDILLVTHKDVLTEEANTKHIASRKMHEDGWYETKLERLQ
jgi:hypothetical protein